MQMFFMVICLLGSTKGPKESPL